ncbi:hypothetical protein SLH46_00660 [Draconibacterium sp. IB214405]|uniref:hypothetical protein n=1 Tax=Draconibacterium sp. IB214405 TaxID=3097352 RepID=UPI002A1713C9|nr:hypothetical protein [Draconibacterium sp. IB214405]MDX8337671.1 hypothetical protein [Draconibacterium sp. IB214405]
MKNLFFLLFLFMGITTFAQKQFVVQNGTAQSFDDINDAIAAASAGDTLYLPGGGFYIDPATIDKTLHWRGVGHYPDSTAATGHTQITNAVNFTGNCDNSTFEGIYFQTTVTFGSNDDECTGVTMKRCRVWGTLYMRSTTDISTGAPDLGFHLTECVTQALDARYSMNARVEKNLIFSTLNNFNRSFFNHNSLNDYDGYNRVIRYCENCQFTNNVFGYSYGLYYTYNCNFENNLFQSTLPYDPTTSTITGSGNIINIGSGNIYEDISNSANIYTFSYDNDYHLNTSTTGTDENGNTGVSITGNATDGTNPGVYGTALPYKEGAVPYSPHIQTANIDNEAVSGNLGVQINVAAQER